MKITDTSIKNAIWADLKKIAGQFGCQIVTNFGIENDEIWIVTPQRERIVVTDDTVAGLRRRVWLLNDRHQVELNHPMRHENTAWR